MKNEAMSLNSPTTPSSPLKSEGAKKGEEAKEEANSQVGNRHWGNFP